MHTHIYTFLKRWQCANENIMFQAGAKGLPPALHIQDEQEWKLVCVVQCGEETTRGSKWHIQNKYMEQTIWVPLGLFKWRSTQVGTSKRKNWTFSCPATTILFQKYQWILWISFQTTPWYRPCILKKETRLYMYILFLEPIFSCNWRLLLFLRVSITGTVLFNYLYICQLQQQ